MVGQFHRIGDPAQGHLGDTKRVERRREPTAVPRLEVKTMRISKSTAAATCAACRTTREHPAKTSPPTRRSSSTGVDDVLHGGLGKDRLSVTPGNDAVYGEPGDETLDGGADTLTGCE